MMMTHARSSDTYVGSAGFDNPSANQLDQFPPCHLTESSPLGPIDVVQRFIDGGRHVLDVHEDGRLADIRPRRHVKGQFGDMHRFQFHKGCHFGQGLIQ